MFVDKYEYSGDEMRYEEKAQRIGQPVKRAKASRRRVTHKSNQAPGSPGGIRQRRNKRWNW